MPLLGKHLPVLRRSLRAAELELESEQGLGEQAVVEVQAAELIWARELAQQPRFPFPVVRFPLASPARPRHPR